MFVFHAGSRGLESYQWHMSKQFFRSNRPIYPNPVCSKLENGGIRVVVCDCSVTEHRRWRPPYQTGKTVHVYAKHYKHNEDRRMVLGVCGHGSLPLSHSGNVVKRIALHTYLWMDTAAQMILTYYIPQSLGIAVRSPALTSSF